ncbi:MAG: ABC transporter ATP-binding protein [Sphingomonadales bacterium]
MTSPVLELHGIERTFHQGGRELKILQGVNLTLKPGEIVGLLGPSGSGKSTVLHIAGLLEGPNAGEVIINGKACSTLAESDRTLMRRNCLGFIYQFHHLMQDFTAQENVMLPLRIMGKSKKVAAKTALALLKSVHLGDRVGHLPSQLSGGEQQRVAIARAMANTPLVVLADEPTGNLDEATADKVMDVFIETARKKQMAALIATHNTTLAKRMDRCLYLHNGKLSKKPI